jgi:hypothetical protein
MKRKYMMVAVMMLRSLFVSHHPMVIHLPSLALGDQMFPGETY